MIAALWVLLIVANISAYLPWRSAPIAYDFSAFYCAGKTLSAHNDPYRSAMLGRCEHHETRNAQLYGTRNLVIPAPLPPYALLGVESLSHLPYNAASALWRLMSALAMAATVFAMQRLTRLPWLLILASLFPIGVVQAIALGQVVPFVLAALTVAAWALNRKAPRLAGAIICLAMLEPHVGLPACVALYIWQPAARLTLGIGALVTTLLCAFALPHYLTIEYLTTVLPQHALAEAPWFKQYSLTHVLFLMGINASLAVWLGSLSYVFLTGLGLFVAASASDRLGTTAALVLIPPAFAVFLGAYVHGTQMPAATLTALFLAAKAQGMQVRFAVIACALLAIPWIDIGLAPMAIIAFVALSTIVLQESPVSPARLATVALAVAIAVIFHRMPPDLTPAFSLDERAAPEISWAQYVREANPSAMVQAVSLAAQAPTWLGLLLVTTLAVKAKSGDYETANIDAARQ